MKLDLRQLRVRCPELEMSQSRETSHVASAVAQHDLQRIAEICGTTIGVVQGFMKLPKLHCDTADATRELDAALQSTYLVTSLQNMSLVSHKKGMHAMTILLTMTVLRLTLSAPAEKAALRGAAALLAVGLPLAAAWLLEHVRDAHALPVCLPFP